MPASQTVKEFVDDSYSLITSGSPTVPLHGNDLSKAVRVLNRLLSSYSATGLNTTIAKLVSFPLVTNKAFVTFADPDFIPPVETPPIVIDVAQGRLSNLENAWINLDGLDYPLFDESRNVFFDSYKYFPLSGLPRYCIVTNNLDYTTMQIYPKPSQFYTLFVYGKFELPVVLASGTMALIPQYMNLFLQLALARYLSVYKARSQAWTPQLQEMYEEELDNIQAASAVNLAIQSDDDSYLNGHWRVQSGI
jgi:hypothetical protein